MNQLRPYQQSAVDQIIQARNKGARAVLLISPTGSGKTRMVSAAIAKMGMRCVSFAHRREIIGQIGRAMAHAGVQKHWESGVASSKSILLAQGDECDSMFFDEAHHIAASSYRRLLKAGKGKFILAATATPYRADGARIDHIFDAVISAGSAKKLAEDGYLAKVQYCAASNVDFDGIKRSIKNDFDEAEAFERVRISIQAGDVVDSWKEHSQLAPALIYCINQQHCELVSEELELAGLRSKVITSRTRATDRRDSILQFETGAIHALINCEIFTEGTDIAGVHTIIMLRPTLSRGLYKQIIGRGLRPDVDCVVIDHVGNSDRHGDVLNEDETAVMGEQGAILSPDGARGIEVSVGRMAMHIEKIDAQIRKIFVPSVFLAGGAV